MGNCANDRKLYRQFSLEGNYVPPVHTEKAFETPKIQS